MSQWEPIPCKKCLHLKKVTVRSKEYHYCNINGIVIEKPVMPQRGCPLDDYDEAMMLSRQTFKYGKSDKE